MPHKPRVQVFLKPLGRTELFQEQFPTFSTVGSIRSIERAAPFCC